MGVELASDEMVIEVALDLVLVFVLVLGEGLPDTSVVFDDETICADSGGS